MKSVMLLPFCAMSLAITHPAQASLKSKAKGVAAAAVVVGCAFSAPSFLFNLGRQIGRLETSDLPFSTKTAEIAGSLLTVFAASCICGQLGRIAFDNLFEPEIASQ